MIVTPRLPHFSAYKKMKKRLNSNFCSKQTTKLLSSTLKTAQTLPVRDKSKSVMVVTGFYTVTCLFMVEFDEMLS
jgi:hypothetical protein